MAASDTIKKVSKMSVGDIVRVSLSDAPEFTARIVSIKGDAIQVERLYRDGTSSGRLIVITESRISDTPGGGAHTSITRRP